MPPRRRKFTRPLGERRYRRLFILATEGKKTEPQYFAIFNNENSYIHVSCLKGKHDNSPVQVLRRMETHLRREGLRHTDEAWLIVDKDQWTDHQLSQLHAWSQKADNYGFALSNPRFEYWLLLHFEEGNNVNNSRTCMQKLERYLPDYDKSINVRKITKSRIHDAIRRARQRDTPQCEGWPRTTGTTVYRLVENILGLHNNR